VENLGAGSGKRPKRNKARTRSRDRERRGDEFPAEVVTPGRTYPNHGIRITPFAGEFERVFPEPAGLAGLAGEVWPPTQVRYLDVYLRQLNCQTVVIEEHYIDRDYMADHALFYSKSLRAYPNHCRRLHFFSESFDDVRFKRLVAEANQRGHDEVIRGLQRSYLGFCVVRPLPGCPLGRTVLPPPTNGGTTAVYRALREYVAHLAGFTLHVRGLAFQQQDQGVSACATTALWSSIHRVAEMEGLRAPTPAEITEAASRYLLADGRSLPSEGLSIHQMCEAIRAAGLAPLVIRSVSLEPDLAQFLGYATSGFAPILAIQPVAGGVGHAVCGVGVRLGEVKPQTNPTLHYRDGASAVCGAYVHDDRLGPYAIADFSAFTHEGAIRTAVTIHWPDRVEDEQSLLYALVVPVPIKLRLPITRIRVLGLAIADAAGQLFKRFDSSATLNCCYEMGTDYRRRAYGFGLSDEGLYALVSSIVLSRYVGLIEITSPEGPLFDVLLDTTETAANPAALACIRREVLRDRGVDELRFIATKLGAHYIA